MWNKLPNQLVFVVILLTILFITTLHSSAATNVALNKPARQTWNLPAGAGNNANFQLRFRTSHNGSTDYAYLDEVQIIGTP